MVSKDIIEKKMRLAQKRRIEALFENAKPQGSGPLNHHGMPKLPVGQREVHDWPVLDLGIIPDLTKETWKMSVTGLVENPITVNFEEFMKLKQTDEISDFHCVTGWSRMNNHWKGVKLRTLAEIVRVKGNATFVIITGYDKAPGTDIYYTTNLPLDKALEEDVLLVHTWENQDLPLEHGGPVRMITPRLYAWKGSKWVKEISFVANDFPGFWEVRGYSNTAEPWYNDRYSYTNMISDKKKDE